MKSIVALFDDPRAVVDAVSALLEHGIHVDHINAVCPVEPDVARRIELHDPTETTERAPMLSASHTDLGHLLVDAGFLTVPTVGVTLAVGPRLGPMALLHDDPLGTGIDSLRQRLHAVGIPPLDAERYAAAVRRGSALVLLTVHEVCVEDAAKILAHYQPSEPSEQPMPSTLPTPPTPEATMGSRP